MNGKAPGSSSVQLLHQLKRRFKAHGLTYGDIAKTINVSEKSIKRYMNGKGLTLIVLEQLCSTVGLSLLDLAELTAREHEETIYMTEEQEELLGRDMFIGLIFHLIKRGWAMEELKNALELDEVQLDAALLKLDRLGVIRLSPGRHVRVIAKTKTGVRTPRRRGLDNIRKAWTRVINSADPNDPELIWRIGTAYLPAHSLPDVAKLFDDFLEQVYKLEVRDKAPRDRQLSWCHIPMCIVKGSPMASVQAPPQ